MLKTPGVLDSALQERAENGTEKLSRVATGTPFLSYASVVPAGVRTEKIHQLANLLEQANRPTDNLPVLAMQLQLQKEQLLNDTEADIQFNFGATGVNTSSTNDISKMFTHTDPGGYAGVRVVSTHPFSRGSIHIQSPDAKVYPVNDPRYLSHPIDMELMTAGVLFTQKISATKPLADFLKENSSGNGKRIRPGFNFGEDGLTEARATAIVKEYTITSFHLVGTCSMLPEEDGGLLVRP
jgi:choline dehydrogenase-like flavoprotein